MKSVLRTKKPDKSIVVTRTTHTTNTSLSRQAFQNGMKKPTENQGMRRNPRPRLGLSSTR